MTILKTARKQGFASRIRVLFINTTDLNQIYHVKEMLYIFVVIQKIARQ